MATLRSPSTPIALMFACARDIALSDRKIRGGTWEPLEGVQLYGKTLGVIGLGGIGAEVARIGAGIGMKVIGWNRTVRPIAGVTPVDIDTLLASADVIALCLSLTDETRGFLDAARLARIKPGAIIVNTARGALVDEAGLIDALRSGRIRHAGLDVFHAEPLKPDHPLAQLPNVTLSPHAAFRTPEASENLLRRGARHRAQGPWPAAGVSLVARMERSAMRGRPLPDCGAPHLHPGYALDPASPGKSIARPGAAK